MIGWVAPDGELVRVSAIGEPVPECNGLVAIDVPEGFHGGGLEWDADAQTFVVPDRIGATKASLRVAVCARAEMVRARFLTPGSGQAITYARKEAEARGWASGGNPASVPFLAAEASAIGMTIDVLAQLVIAQADAWIAVGSAIEARRRGLLVAIDDAAAQLDLDAIDITTGWPEASA